MKADVQSSSSHFRLTVRLASGTSAYAVTMPGVLQSSHQQQHWIVIATVELLISPRISRGSVKFPRDRKTTHDDLCLLGAIYTAAGARISFIFAAELPRADEHRPRVNTVYSLRAGNSQVACWIYSYNRVMNLSSLLSHVNVP